MDTTDYPESVLIEKGPCPECPSSDGFTTWSDGHGYCFVCEHRTPADPEYRRSGSTPRKRMNDYQLIQGETRGFTTELGLTEETCRKLGIQVVRYAAEWKGERLKAKDCLAFTYRKDDGELHGQKIRYARPDPVTDKTFAFPNAGGTPPLWLMDRWGQGADTRTLVIFEGEKGAASYFQVTGGKYPVVSIPTGAKGAPGVLKKHYEWLDRFDKIVLVFDGDLAGRENVKEAAKVLPAGKVFVGEVIGFKDANEALKAGDTKAIQTAFWNAEIFKPDGIVMSHEFVSGLRKRRLLQEASKITYPWDGLTAITHGIYEGDVITFLAGSGVGKSTIVRHIAHHVHTVHKVPVGMLMLEEDKDDTLDGLIGIQMGRNILMDPNLCTDEEHEDAIRSLGFDNSETAIAVYDHFGSTDVDNICARISFMARALGRKVIVLDHVSIMVSGTETGDERKLIDMAMTKLKTVAMAEKITLFVVVHLKRPQGDKGHEDGAEVRAGQARGSHSIIQLSNVVIGAQKDPDEPHADFVDLVVLKNRKAGRKGFACRLGYGHDTGILTEDKGYSPAEKKKAGGFKDRSKQPDGDDGGLDL